MIAVLDLGIPFLNHLGRSKFIRFCSSILVTFGKEIYGIWRRGPLCYPNQWPCMKTGHELYGDEL